MMRVAEFDYDLPESLIALRPAVPRESARLLCVPGCLDKTIADLPGLLTPDDLLVFNNTKVIPARLFGKRGEMKVEVMLHRFLADGAWEAFARPAKRLREGERIVFAPDFSALVTGKDAVAGSVFLKLESEDVTVALVRHGHMPLPPYIQRADDEADKTDYQTIFARNPGAVAAPTASLHFTPDLLAKLPASHCFVTLHVGAGTFQPVRVDDTKDHFMHAEWAEVSAEVIEKVRATKARGGRVVAVGTTALRALESAGTAPFAGDTRLFITPGYRFKTVDALLTNFHLPKSTLLMLVSAFAGPENIKKAYAHAIENGYRFYSYGDACFLTRADEGADDAV